jgi:hypothetical protein
VFQLARADAIGLAELSTPARRRRTGYLESNSGPAYSRRQMTQQKERLARLRERSVRQKLRKRAYDGGSRTKLALTVVDAVAGDRGPCRAGCSSVRLPRRGSSTDRAPLPAELLHAAGKPK